MSEQRITAIDIQDRRSNRRSIFVNGNFALGVDEKVVANLGLHIGQAISEEALKEIVRAELVAKARERALKLLEYRQRSKAEVVRRLTQAGFTEDVVEETVEYLLNIGFLNDTEFSQSFVNQRLSGKSMGKTRIRWELRQKGVSEEIVQEAISEIDAETDYQSAIIAARHKWERDSSDESKKRRRLTAFLQRKGFQWETISRVIRELAQEPEPD